MPLRALIFTSQVELKDDRPVSEHESEQYFNYRNVPGYLYPFPSNSKSFLKIHRVEKKLPCGQPQQLRVEYLFDEAAMGIELQKLDVVFLVSLHLGRDGTLPEGQSSGEENQANGVVGLSPGQLLLGSGLRDGAWSSPVLGHHLHPSCRMQL